jgi:thioredoxin 1
MNYKIICVIMFCGTAYPAAPVAQSATEQVRTQPPAVPVDSSQILADRIIKSQIPVLVDFWAPWCKPCLQLTPIISLLKKEYAGRITVTKINVDVHKRIAAYFRVSTIPAVFIVKDKAVVKFIGGVQGKDAYTAAIEEVLSPGPSGAPPDHPAASQPSDTVPARKTTGGALP